VDGQLEQRLTDIGLAATAELTPGATIRPDVTALAATAAAPSPGPAASERVASAGRRDGLRYPAGMHLPRDFPATSELGPDPLWPMDWLLSGVTVGLDASTLNPLDTDANGEPPTPFGDGVPFVGAIVIDELDPSCRPDDAQDRAEAGRGPKLRTWTTRFWTTPLWRTFTTSVSM